MKPASNPTTPYSPTVTPSFSDAIATTASIARPRVIHPSKLRPGRIDTMGVAFDALTPITSFIPGQPVQARPFLPGCLVTPDEVSIDPAHPIELAFFVTPLAAGPIPAAHIDWVRDGTLIQRTPLKLQSTAPRSAWRWALAGAVVPFLWCWLTTHAGLTTPSGADAVDGPLAVALRHHLPNVGAKVATSLQHALDAGAGYEAHFRLGLWFAVALASIALLTKWSNRRRTLTTYGATVVLAGPSPSKRSRVPPYLTPVPPEELNHIHL